MWAGDTGDVPLFGKVVMFILLAIIAWCPFAFALVIGLCPSYPTAWMCH